MAPSRPSIADKRRTFAQLHESGCFAIPNPFDVGSALFLQSLRFKAIATTSSGFAWTIGHADNRVPREAVLAHLAAMVAATDIPVNADFESGFAADAAGVPTARPYDLRHSYVSLLIAQGATVVEVARQAGHAPTMTLSTYAHLFDELDGADHRPAEDQIRTARLATMSPEVSVLCPRPGHDLTPETEKPRFSGAFREPTPGLEPGTPSLRVKCSTS